MPAHKKEPPVIYAQTLRKTISQPIPAHNLLLCHPLKKKKGYNNHA
jgi:hypothetical protein